MSEILLEKDRIPWNVKQKIIDFSDVTMMPTLRQVTKEFKLLVDNSAITYQCLQLLLLKLHWGYHINITLKINEATEHSINFQFEDIESAFLHLSRILKNPKITFEKLKISTISPFRKDQEAVENYNLRKEEFWRNFEKVLSQMKNNELSVKSLEIQNDGSQDDILRGLKCVRPGILKSIAFGGFQRIKVIELDQVVETDQWKQANEFNASGSKISVPFEEWSHFSNVKVYYYREFPLEVFKNIIQGYLTSPTIKNGKLYVNNCLLDDILNFMQQFPRILPNRSKGDEWRLDIPNSSDFFIVFIDRIVIGITRVS